MPYKSKDDRKEYAKRYRSTHRDKFREYYHKNKEKYKERRRSYRKNSQLVRASHLLATYNRMDEKKNIGNGNLTTQWIIENIFTKPCAHCGKEGWKVIGCNRLDNSKPHTMDNVEPCCYECNVRLSYEERKKQVCQYTLEGELVKIWESAREAQRNGYDHSAIAACCKGKFKQYKGYRWSYEPL